MSNVALFAWGVVVSVLVFSAVGLMIYGAILDGRTERDYREGRLGHGAVEGVPELVPVPARSVTRESRDSALPPSEAA